MKDFVKRALAVSLSAVAIVAGRGDAATPNIVLRPWVQEVQFSGDLRLRQETFAKEAQGQADINRQRFRLRLEADFLLPRQMAVITRLASGTGEQFSTNQSLTSLSSEKEIWIDWAFLEWKPRPFLRLAGGRMSNPFWRTYASDIVWDEDFNPEGFSQSFEWPTVAGARLFVNLLQMAADEDPETQKDQWMFGEQLGAEAPLPAGSRARAAGAYYQWKNENIGTFDQPKTNEGNRRTGTGALQNNFGVLELSGEFSTSILSLPCSIQGSFIENVRADKNLTPKENSGYQAGFRLGRAAIRGAWELGYFFKRTETDATVADVADADFGDGGTNRKGHILWLAYNAEDWIQVKTKYFDTQVINENLPPNADGIRRLQFDVALRF
ncbi:MAG: putative porin [Elusimicrobia bacterium]|nr:putative porin [Elusimicrobiota bacterium]